MIPERTQGARDELHLPRLHTDRDGEKKVSWLEFFYDLIFVAAIIQLGDALSQQVTASQTWSLPCLSFSAHMLPLWLAWTGFTFFANRFELDDFLHRFLVLIQMLAVGTMAVAGPRAMHGAPHLFAGTFAFAQAAWSPRCIYRPTATSRMPGTMPATGVWSSPSGRCSGRYRHSCPRPTPTGSGAWGCSAFYWRPFRRPPESWPSVSLQILAIWRSATGCSRSWCSASASSKCSAT